MRAVSTNAPTSSESVDGRSVLELWPSRALEIGTKSAEGAIRILMGNDIIPHHLPSVSRI